MTQVKVTITISAERPQDAKEFIETMMEAYKDTYQENQLDYEIDY